MTVALTFRTSTSRTKLILVRSFSLHIRLSITLIATDLSASSSSHISACGSSLAFPLRRRTTCLPDHTVLKAPSPRMPSTFQADCSPSSSSAASSATSTSPVCNALRLTSLTERRPNAVLEAVGTCPFDRSRVILLRIVISLSVASPIERLSMFSSRSSGFTGVDTALNGWRCSNVEGNNFGVDAASDCNVVVRVIVGVGTASRIPGG
jgi:hypothetical protein